MNYTTTSQEILNKAFDRETRALKTIARKKPSDSDIQKDFFLEKEGLSIQEIFNAVYDRETGCLTINGSGGGSDPGSDYYTKTEIDNKFVSYYTKTEVDNKFVDFSQNMFWKESVATFSEIDIKYPNPKEGWTVSVNDTNIIYRYDDETSQWIDIGKSVTVAGYDTQGVASFDSEYFIVTLGHVSVNTDKLASKDYVDEKIEETQPVLSANQIKFINWGASLSETELNNLQDYVNNYDYFVNYLKNNFEVKEEVITMLPVAQGGSVTPVYITIQGETQNVDDDGNLDGDIETQYRFDIAGYVVDVESYGSNTATQTDRFYPKIVYDKECKDVIDNNIDKTFGITHIYFSQEEYDQISSLDSSNNKNIVKIHYVQFKKNI